MRVTTLGHACHLVEVDGRWILTDPWLVDPIFAGHIERDPALRFGPADLPPLHAVALTHGHLDHLNAPTLAALPHKDVPVVHPPARHTELDRSLRLLGFTELHAREDWKPFEIGSVRIVPTPSRGVLDECAFWIEGRSGSFWNGADAPQPGDLVAEIRARLGSPQLAALSHNSFDQPALLGLPSMKAADHGPEGGARSARLLGARAAFPAASNLRWRGPAGDAVTRKVVRRSHEDFLRRLAEEAPAVEGLDLAPGDAWSAEGGIERGAFRGTPAPRVGNDYLHALLGTGARWCPEGRPTTEETFRRDLPARTRSDPAASRYVGRSVFIEVVGSDPGAFTVDFRSPGSQPAPGDTGAAFALRVPDTDWKDLFERRIPWQVLLVSDRLRVTRFVPGVPPDGLHFAYGLQAIFP